MSCGSNHENRTEPNCAGSMRSGLRNMLTDESARATKLMREPRACVWYWVGVFPGNSTGSHCACSSGLQWCGLRPACSPMAIGALARRSGRPLQPLSISSPAAINPAMLFKPKFMGASLRARDETLINHYPVMPVFVTNKPQCSSRALAATGPKQRQSSVRWFARLEPSVFSKYLFWCFCAQGLGNLLRFALRPGSST